MRCAFIVIVLGGVGMMIGGGIIFALGWKCCAVQDTICRCLTAEYNSDSDCCDVTVQFTDPNSKVWQSTMGCLHLGSSSGTNRSLEAYGVEGDCVGCLRNGTATEEFECYYITKKETRLAYSLESSATSQRSQDRKFLWAAYVLFGLGVIIVLLFGLMAKFAR
eukprot:TRINITY_DN8206_c0_g2_i1.p2 TRINITY_DN8206_c0_g2~~TRINITY_DN8206_c0_g2_i1.p2  ORF type:complete len:163 (-),score=32.29 TRINITY_DN8206_c0_g2_i1:124-612(-)